MGESPLGNLRERSWTFAEALCGHCLQLLTAETIKILQKNCAQFTPDSRFTVRRLSDIFLGLAYPQAHAWCRLHLSTMSTVIIRTLQIHATDRSSRQSSAAAAAATAASAVLLLSAYLMCSIICSYTADRNAIRPTNCNKYPIRRSVAERRRAAHTDRCGAGWVVYR